MPNKDAPRDFVPVDESAGDLIDHEAFFSKCNPPRVRPAKWAFKDVVAYLDKLEADGKYDGNTRYASLNSTDADNNATLPSMWVTIHRLKPGEVITLHRHTPSSVYYIIQGTGFSTINEYRIDWTAGDTYSCPAWSYHEHTNTGDEDVLMFTVQDMPLYAYNRIMLFQPGDSEDVAYLHGKED
jgi:gentisate 1,2-dioxygenase